MNEKALMTSLKEDLAILGLINHGNIRGFRRIFGEDKDHLSISEIIDSLLPMELPILRDLIKRSFDKSGRQDL